MTPLTELPDIGKTTMFHEGDLVVFVEVSQDELAENPCDQGAGRIISLNRNHSNFDVDTFEQRHDDPDCVALSYFEHGNCSWFPQGTGGAGTSCPWDSVRTAGLWIPSKEMLTIAKKMKAPERRLWLIGQAKHFCSAYSDWCNGEVYEYYVTAYEARLDGNGDVFDSVSDYRRDAEAYAAGCSGFYLSTPEDLQYMLDTINADMVRAVENREGAE